VLGKKAEPKGEIEKTHQKKKKYPFQRVILVTRRLLDAIAMVLATLIVGRMVLRLGHLHEIKGGKGTSRGGHQDNKAELENKFAIMKGKFLGTRSTRTGAGEAAAGRAQGRRKKKNCVI
jgi:hypothetical protein